MKYIGFFDINSSNRKRHIFPASRDKMMYIANIISRYMPVEIVSASDVYEKESEKAQCVMLSDRICLRLFYSIGNKNKVIGGLSKIFTRLQLLLYLLLFTKRNEKVIVYHSLGYMQIISLAHTLKRFILILEVEEIYSDVNGSKKNRNKELWNISQADAYLFPTKLLDDLINTDKKPSIIIHGTYQVEEDRNCRLFQSVKYPVEKRIIHCVYAGTLDPRKGGAIAAAAAAKFLPENYFVHILGFGGKRQVEDLKKIIDEIQKSSLAHVAYDGVLSGEEYIRFIQSCDIGLSTQEPSAAFNATSFPSKILSYLANGLKVVSIRIPAIESSDISDLLYYYDTQTPEQISRAIVSVDLNDHYDSRKRIQILSKKFEKELINLLEESW